MNIWERLRRVTKPAIEVESTGRNLTFIHQTQCRRPGRPCGCMPSYRDPDTQVDREFWVTPHANRAARRRQARAALGRTITKAPSKSRRHQS